MNSITWQNRKYDPMTIDVNVNGVTFSIFLGEAMEYAGRKLVMEHVKHCDGQKHLVRWNAKQAKPKRKTK